MGNIFSSEEKLLRRQQEELLLGRDSRRIPGPYEQCGYHQTNYPFGRPNEHRYKKKRNVSFHGRYGKQDYYRSKSHSLNAILEELYSLGPDDSSDRRKINFENGGSLIPRIKLKRSTSSLKEDKSYKTLCEMSSESEILIEGNTTNSTQNLILQGEGNARRGDKSPCEGLQENLPRGARKPVRTDKLTKDVNGNVPHGKITIMLNDQSYNEFSGKSDENYFAKNFDDCMKRLQMIEKEHELIDKDDGELEFCVLPAAEEEAREEGDGEAVYEYKPGGEVKATENVGGEEKTGETKSDSQQEISDGVGREDNSPGEILNTSSRKEEEDKESEETIPSGWYTSLKQQFEKKERESQEQKAKEVSCRITGATLKSQNEKGKPEDQEKETRHYFSRLVKTNKSLIDEELPDPDKVKHIRAMFQENLNSTLKRNVDKQLGGSLQNISVRPSEGQVSRPLSAQCCRNELFCEQRKPETPKSAREGEFQIENTKKKLFEKYEKDLKPGRERNKRVLQPKWTDTGSVSSGISSDLSSYDTDLESYSREGTEQEEMTISDDDLLEEVKDKHYVQNEILDKIRWFGTSVTYYGGEMITCSVGPLLSPTTQAIIEEIGEKCGHGTSPVRSFDEFYRKYVETNEPNRMKKLGRTRSFGQNDVFQKPNVLSNTEIEMYKNDLEIEIGIKKPAGVSQNTLKRKVTKSVSLGCEPEKPKENNAEPADSGTTVEQPERTGSEIKAEAIDSGTVVTPIPEPETENREERSEKSENRESEPVAAEVAPYLRSKSLPEGHSDSKNLPNHIEHPAKEIFFSYEKSIFNGKRNSDMEFEEFEVCESLSEKLEKLEKAKGEGEETDPGREIRGENFGRGTTTTTTAGKQKSNHSRWPIETSVMVDIQKNNEQTPKLITSGKTVAKTKLRLF